MDGMTGEGRSVVVNANENWKEGYGGMGNYRNIMRTSRASETEDKMNR